MVKKPLIDTNVCLDLMLKRNPHLNEAAKIFQLSETDRIEAVISAISFDTLAYIMREGFTIPEVTHKLQGLVSIATVGTANSAVITNALNAQWYDIEDAIQYYCAKENGCDAIITRNRKDFTHSSLKILSPSEFISQI